MIQNRGAAPSQIRDLHFEIASAQAKPLARVLASNWSAGE
jgi:hypothetical protein